MFIGFIALIIVHFFITPLPSLSLFSTSQECSSTFVSILEKLGGKKFNIFVWKEGLDEPEYWDKSPIPNENSPKNITPSSSPTPPSKPLSLFNAPPTSLLSALEEETKNFSFFSDLRKGGGGKGEEKEGEDTNFSFFSRKSREGDGGGGGEGGKGEEGMKGLFPSMVRGMLDREEGEGGGEKAIQGLHSFSSFSFSFLTFPPFPPFPLLFYPENDNEASHSLLLRNLNEAINAAVLVIFINME